MKRGFKQLLALGLCLILAACGEETKEESNIKDEDTTKTSVVEDKPTSDFCSALLKKCERISDKKIDIRGTNFTELNLEEVSVDFGKQYLMGDEILMRYFVDEPAGSRVGLSKVYYYGSMAAPKTVDCRVVFATHSSWEEFNQDLILVDFIDGGAKIKSICLANHYSYVGEANLKATIMDNGNIKTEEVVDVPGHEKTETIIYSNELDILDKN